MVNMILYLNIAIGDILFTPIVDSGRQRATVLLGTLIIYGGI
jgi:hypothetical protein